MENNFTSWDYTFMLEARLWASRSKDPSRKIGAVIVKNDKKTIATGYNGFPKQMEDRLEWLNNREFKYPRTLHAEVNALHNALEFGIIVKDCSIYVFGLPVCENCSIHLIQAGIKRVVYCDLNSNDSIWSDSCTRAKELMESCGMKVDVMTIKEVDNYEKICYNWLR